MSNIAILTAGGIGSRTHQDIPKQFIHVNNLYAILINSSMVSTVL